MEIAKLVDLVLLAKIVKTVRAVNDLSHEGG
jgi:hypothetical protein